jgi:uncharacterized protein with HEPN domain
MRDDMERARDIWEAIENVERYAVQGRDAFENDELIQVWILHHLQIVGEAALSEQKPFRRRHRHIPWKALSETRNVLVHQYFGLNLARIWEFVEQDLPGLKAQIADLLGDELTGGNKEKQKGRQRDSDDIQSDS